MEKKMENQMETGETMLITMYTHSGNLIMGKPY